MIGNDAAKLADPKLLEVIDALFELNVGNYVALPQLLVVGDQSSGKSSVLEGLTGIPYPRDSQLCTRFATQITFRRAPEVNFTVSLIPANNSKPEYAAKLWGWRKDNLDKFSANDFAEVLKDVNHILGLDDADGVDGDTKKTFSDDVLKIEICGPEQQHLSVIDVPGIFRKTTAGITTKTDMELVRNMVLSYMKNPRSAMLAVIPANVDIGTQEILELAETCDPKGERTLGVLTKPDLVDKGAEQNVIDIVEGKAHSLNLGWCILRNPGQKDLRDKPEERHKKEQHFFSTESPWNGISKDSVGVVALQNRLVDILADLIRREFPNVKSDINKRLKYCKKRLETLGPHRESQDEQYKYLLELATRYQDVTFLALQAQYGGDDIFDSSPCLRLATAIVDRNDRFSRDLQDVGHTRKFKENVLDPDPVAKDQGDDVRINVCSSKLQSELEDFIPENDTVFPPKATGIKRWLEEVYRKSRGYALGTFDVSLLSIVWKAQSSNWDALAIGYISDIVSLVHNFTVELLEKICKDNRIRHELRKVLLDRLMDRYKRAIDHTKFLLSVERGGTPLTTNHYFAENLEKSRKQRMKTQLEKNQIWTSNGYLVSPDSVMQGSNQASNLDQTICDLHDILKSYYKVARKRFVDNVCMQAADFYLVHGPDSPIRVFSPTFVNELTKEQLEAIAGEDVATKRKRADLEREIKSLESGRKLL